MANQTRHVTFVAHRAIPLLLIAVAVLGLVESLSGAVPVRLIPAGTNTTVPNAGIQESYICSGYDYSIRLDGQTMISGSAFPSSIQKLAEHLFYFKVGKDYLLEALGPQPGTSSNYLGGVNLAFETSDCYRFRTNHVLKTNGANVVLTDGDCDSQLTNFSRTIAVVHKDGLWLDFDTCRDGDNYILLADGHSVARPSISKSLGAPSLTPPLQWSIISKDTLGCQIDPTNGLVRAGERGGQITVKVTDSASPPCEVLGDLLLVRCQNCDPATCIIGTVLVWLGSLDVDISLGRGLSGEAAGSLSIHSDTGATNMASPALLRYNYQRHDTEVITNSTTGEIQQVKTPQGLAHVQVSSSSLYSIKFFAPTNVGVKTNGFYATNGLPFTIVTVQDPAPGVPDCLNITDGNNVTHSFTNSGGTWTLNSSSGLRRERQETAWSATNTVRTVTHTVQNSQNQTNAVRTRKFRTFAWGEVLVEETSGAGANAQTNRYDYSADGRTRTNTLANGSWQIEFFDTAGRVTNLFAAFTNASPTTDKTQCRFIEYVYSSTVLAPFFVDVYGLVRTNIPRRVTEYLLNNEVSRTYNVFIPYETNIVYYQQVRLTPNASWTFPFGEASGYLTTTTSEHRDNSWDGLPQSVLFPDGNVAVYDYSFNRLSNTFSYGLLDSSAYPPIVVTNDRFKVITVMGSLGEPLSRTVIDLGSRQTNALEVFSNHDAYGRPRNVRFLDGTSNSIEYGCCGPETITSRENVVTALTYDNLKRPLTASANGLVYISAYDADGNLLSLARRGTDGSTNITTRFGYDWAGRTTNAIDALNHTTSVTETAPPVVRTTMYADGGTRVEEFYQDGSLKRVMGTAVFPIRYEYGVSNNLTFRKEIRLDADGNGSSEWTMFFYDMAGREVKTVESAAPGQPNPTRQRSFNYDGRVASMTDPDGVTTLFSYIPNGDINFAAVDMNGNASIDHSGVDRVLALAYSAPTVNGVPVRRVSVDLERATGGPLNLEVRDVSADGLRTWTTAFGRTNRTEVLHTNGNLYVIQTAPDGTATVSGYSTGRLVSVQVTNVALGSLRSLTFGYDAHGRRNRVTDAHTGTTTNVYNEGDQVTATYTPAPGSGQASIGTGFDYDDRGRHWHTYLPGGGTITTQFYPNGMPFSRSGALTLPVQYDRDAQGRLRHLVTWTNYFGSPNGAATNTWDYDAYRGLLSARVFPDGTSNTFTFTNSGRLVARAWARGVTNRYGYNIAGELAAVDYSDNTPDLAFTRDLLGRVTQVTQGTNVTIFTLHDSGVVLSETNNGQLTLTNGFDALLRRTRVFANPTNWSLTDYAFDAASRLAGVTNQDGSLSATYAYLTNSPLLAAMTMRSNNSVRLTTSQSFDNLDRLLNVTHTPALSGQPSISFAYGYNLKSQRTAITNAEGARWAFGFDLLGQLNTGQRYWPDGAAVAGQQFEYVFNEIGNRLWTARGGDETGANLRSANYTNNAVNQITGREVPGYVEVLGRAASNATVTVNNQRVNGRQAFEYWRYELAAANSNALALVGITNIGVYQDPNSATNQPSDIVTTNLTSVLLPKTPEVFKYDADGNLTNNGLWSLKWDGENRLIEMESVSAVPASERKKLVFGYDWQGRRVSKTVSNYTGSVWQLQSARRWIWDGARPLAELEATNSTVSLRQWFTWGMDESGTLDGAGGVGGLVGLRDYTPNGSSLFTASDAQGNVAGMVDSASGTLGGRLEHGPFGELLRASGVAAFLPLRWSTKYEDAESGFIYYGRRYYDPVTGRWLSRDPIGEAGGANLYGFVGNDPVNNFDDTGLAPHGNPVTARGVVIGPSTPYTFNQWAPPGTDGGSPTTRWVLYKLGAAGQCVGGAATAAFGVTLATGGTLTEVGTLGASSPVSLPAAAGGLFLTGVGVDNFTTGGYNLFHDAPARTVTEQVLSRGFLMVMPEAQADALASGFNAGFLMFGGGAGAWGRSGSFARPGTCMTRPVVVLAVEVRAGETTLDAARSLLTGPQKEAFEQMTRFAEGIRTGNANLVYEEIYTLGQTQAGRQQLFEINQALAEIIPMSRSGERASILINLLDETGKFARGGK